MADEILIKVRADVDGFKADMDEAKKIGNSAIQDIEKNDLFGKAANNAQELKKSLELIAKASGNIKLDGLNIDELVNDTSQLKKLIDALSQSLKGMKSGTSEFNSLDAIIKSANIQLTKLNVTSEATGKSLRTQMRLAQQEVAELSAKFGSTSKQAIDAAKRASELKDKIGDAKNLTDAFNPDAKFNALSKSITGLASGFSAVQGAMGLIGSESENVQKTLLKVQSALALSQGLQGLGDAKDSFTNLKAVAIDAFKGIRAAIGSTGIGLLVVALGTVVAYWDDIKEAISGVSAEQRKLNSESEKNLKAEQDKLKTLNNQDNVLKLQGKTEREIRNIKIASINDTITAAKINLNNQISTLKSQYELGKRNKEILKGLIELTSIPLLLVLRAVDKAGTLLGKNFGLAEGFKETLSNFVFDPVGDAKEQIESIKTLQNEIKNLENTRAGLILENKKQEKEALDKRKKDEEEYFDYLDNRLEEEAKKQIKQWEDEAKAEKDLDDYIDKLLDDAAKKQVERWAEERKNANSVGTAIGDAYKRGYQTAEEYQQRLFEEQKKNLNEILSFAQNGILLQLGLNPQDVENLKNGINNALNVINNSQKVLDDLNATFEEKNEARLNNTKAISQAIASGISTVSNAIFAADTQRRQEELAALQTQQEEELRRAGDNEQKKDVIRQKYILKEKDIKRKQAEADKRKAIFDATVNAAVAFVKAAPNPILMAITAALGAAQIALIAATPIPKFAKGGAVPSSDIQGIINGRPHEAGGVLIEAEGNEFITRKSQAMKGENLGLLEAINMSDSERDAYINRHYVMPALQAKESRASEMYRHSIIQAENNLIARVSSHTLKSIHKEQRNTTEAIKRLDKKNFSW